MEENKEKSEKEKDLEKTNEIKAKILLEELKLKYPIFNNNNLKEDDILIFKHEGIVITHRVVHTRKNGNSRQFITRGDHNENEDPFVVEESQVVGRVLIINKFIGFPTVWLNELFRTKQS